MQVSIAVFIIDKIRLLSMISLLFSVLSLAALFRILELTPAGTLTGIAKRNLKGVELFNLNTPDQLGEARAFCEAHSTKA